MLLVKSIFVDNELLFDISFFWDVFVSRDFISFITPEKITLFEFDYKVFLLLLSTEPLCK